MGRANRFARSRTGHEPVENRGPLFLLVGTLPGQPDLWRPSPAPRHAACDHCAATALRMAATMLLRSPSYLGAQYRRLRTRLGAPKAITAMAHRLARLVYRMLQYGQPYVDKGTDHYDQKYRDQQIQSLKKKAAKLGLQLVPALPS
jgi:hypothetical protein